MTFVYEKIHVFEKLARSKSELTFWKTQFVQKKYRQGLRRLVGGDRESDSVRIRFVGCFWLKKMSNGFEKVQLGAELAYFDFFYLKNRIGRKLLPRRVLLIAGYKGNPFVNTT